MGLSPGDNQAGTRRKPWSSLPTSAARDLAGVVHPAVGAIVSEIEGSVPAYRADLDGPFGTAVRRGVEIALTRFLSLFGTDDPALAGRALHVYWRVGAGECREGRSLEALLAAYRSGARVAWDQMATAARQSDMSTEHLVTLAEAIFVYIDELSGVSVEGYAAEQAARAGYRDVLRSRLAELLLDGGMTSAPDTVRELADAAAWRIPERLAVAVIPMPQGPTDRRVPTAPPDALVLERAPDVLAVIPDPSGPGRRERLTAGITDAEVYVGTVRAPTEAGLSLTHAHRVRRLVAQGIVPAAPVVAAADWLPEMVLAADEGLLTEMALRVLAPLEAVPPGRRATLQETLQAWLAHLGDRQAVAQALVVHPQTVSYRMGTLSTMFGAALDDPRSRLALQVALTARAAPRPAGP